LQPPIEPIACIEEWGLGLSPSSVMIQPGHQSTQLDIPDIDSVHSLVYFLDIPWNIVGTSTAI